MFGKKYESNNLEIFLLFGVLHAAILLVIDHTNIIPKDIFPFPLYLVEQVFTVLMVFFLLSYNGHKSIALLGRSAILAIIACIPSISYLMLEFSSPELHNNKYNVMLLAIATLMCLFINYSYQKYNTLSLMYYQIYDAIYTSIAKLILATVYFLLILVCGIMIKALFALLGSHNIQSMLESSMFRKCYISVATVIAMWHTYNREYIADLLRSVINTTCYYAYWIIAPAGLIFIIAYLYSSLLFLKLTHINYDIILAICFVSMICNMRLHATESHWKKQPQFLVAVTNIYNKALPVLSMLLLYNIFFHFKMDTAFLDCKAHIMDTGIHWSNVAILILIAFLVLNNAVAAFFTNKSVQEQNNNLPIVAWYSFYAIILACYAVFVMHANDLEHSIDHVATCEHFKEHKLAAITNIRYLA